MGVWNGKRTPCCRQCKNQFHVVTCSYAVNREGIAHRHPEESRTDAASQTRHRTSAASVSRQLCDPEHPVVSRWTGEERNAVESAAHTDTHEPRRRERLGTKRRLPKLKCAQEYEAAQLEELGC